MTNSFTHIIPTFVTHEGYTYLEFGRNPVPRYQTIDDEFWDPKNRDLQIRISAKFQADALAVAARIRASHGPDSVLLEALGLDD